VRYMLLIYTEEPPQSEAPGSAGETLRELAAGATGGAAGATGLAGDPPEVSPDWMEYTDWLLREGMHAAGEQLAGSTAATTVRVRDGNRLITDGPYAETKEVLGGYYIVHCDNLDEALEAAARCPGALFGSIEVRPILGMAAPRSV
jgi:hypothetical protein